MGYRVWEDEKSISIFPDDFIERRVNVGRVIYLVIVKGDSQGSGGTLCFLKLALLAWMRWGSLEPPRGKPAARPP
jgi:hypothetical protein